MSISRSRIIWRGICHRCPNCGERGLFRRGFTLHRACPGCGLEFERGEGFFLGSMSINYGVTVLVCLLPVLVLGLTGALPVAWAVGLALAGAVCFPVLCYRSSRSWWLAAFYAFLPHELPANRRDLEEGEDDNV